MENGTNTKEFNHEAGLKVIYEMIESAKSKIGKNYFYYLFWGYLIAATCIIEYVLIVLVKYPHHYFIWPVLMPLGTIVTILFYLREKRAVTSKSFIGTTMGFLWSGWVISFVILLLFVNLKNDYNLIIPVTLAMYGLAIFVAGGVVNFRPLLLGAVMAWLASIAAYFVPYNVQLMIMTGVVVVAYIVPGHILKNKSKS
jgi:hypothetical protein